MTVPGPPLRDLLSAIGFLLLSLPSGTATGQDLADDRAAAAAGDPAALVRLAERYETGDGVPFDLSAAGAVFELAAERGDPAAQYRLGLLQAAGLAADADLAEAYGWLRLAAANANENAQIGLLADAMSKALAERLDAAAVERIDQQIAAFEPTAGPAELPVVGAAPPGDLAALLTTLPSTGCGAPLLQRREQSETLLLAYAPAGSMLDGALAPDLRAELARRGAALVVTELSPAICMVREVAAQAALEPGSTEVSVAGTAEDAPVRLRDGDHLVVEIPAADAPRYVAIDYVVHTGEVWHLYPNAGEDGYLPAGQSLRLGDGADGFAWEVGAPFGEDLVLVTLSSLPFASDQPGAEPAEAYRARLAQRLQGPAAGSLRLFDRVVAIEARQP